MKNLICAVLAVVCLVCFSAPQPVYAQKKLVKVLQRLGKSAEDVPFKKLDNFAPDANTSRNVKHLMAKGKQLDELEHTRRLSRMLDETLGEVDPDTLRAIKAYDTPTQEMILLTSRGVKHVDEYPWDLMKKKEFLNAASGETLCAVGMDKNLIQSAVDIQDLVRIGGIKVPDGMRNVTLDDFGRFIYQRGDEGVTFWKYVRKKENWKLWVTGGALAAVLITPEEYMNEVCEWTAEGAKKIAKFGVQIPANMIVGGVGGIGEGIREAIKKFWIWLCGFLTTGYGIAAAVVFTLLLLLFLPLKRIVENLQLIFSPLYKLFRRLFFRKKQEKEKKEPEKEEFRQEEPEEDREWKRPSVFQRLFRRELPEDVD